MTLIPMLRNLIFYSSKDFLENIRNMSVQKYLVLPTIAVGSLKWLNFTSAWNCAIQRGNVWFVDIISQILTPPNPLQNGKVLNCPNWQPHFWKKKDTSYVQIASFLQKQFFDDQRKKHYVTLCIICKNLLSKAVA